MKNKFKAFPRNLESSVRNSERLGKKIQPEILKGKCSTITRIFTKMHHRVYSVTEKIKQNRTGIAAGVENY